ncbi:PEP-CTERM sorting domain-containing protein [Rubrivivax albus]|uniref:PEP-CTERM sorting domain-containing protein n=1 Tax=Rubrivivax albus TaxID=2499835 RepID=A0A3S2TRJ2_9BURK|nr:PEP-CTERM sorting domain-containing protein [Rubrivivax albus]RVT52237.1 PEP-CTERM sorting domain-containing protein [Rubrivivax albus]
MPAQRSPAFATTLTAALALAAMPAWAASTLQVEQRTATLAVTAYAGVAVVDANLPCAGLPFPDTFEQCSFDGSLGDPATVQVALTPGRLEIAGSGRADAAESQWAAALMLDWHTWQEHGVANDSGDAVLTGAGGHGSTLWSEVYGPAIAPGTPGTREVRVWNLQNVFFTLDQTTAYTLSGSSFGEYMPLTLARDDGTGVYVGVGLPGITALSPYSFGGVLAAGRYRLSNFDFVQSDFQDSYAYGWAYTMRFHDTVAAVPEPEALVLMTLGLVALRARARRREA